MKIFLENYRNQEKLHHAYCFVGKKETVRDFIFEFCENELHISIKTNPDVWVCEFDVIKIDDARDIFQMQTKRAFGDSAKKIFIICANAIAREAQNALLKVFEEPTPNTHFFLIIPSAEVLLPTLRSRLEIVEGENEQKNAFSVAQKFLTDSKTGRLSFAKDFATDISDEKKTKTDAITFLNQVEVILHEALKKSVMKKEELTVFEELFKSRDYLNDRAPSVKMILEHLALILPQIK